MKDLYNDVKVVQVIKPHSPAATGTISGAVVDTSGFDNVTFVIMSGLQTTTNLTVTPIVTEGTATDSLTSAANADLLGTEAAAALSGTAGASGVSKIGYKGSKRYVTCDLAVANAATGLYSVSAVLGGAREKPQA